MDTRLISGVVLWLGLLALASFLGFRKTEISQAKWRFSVFAFLLVLAVALPVWRFRSLMYNGEINVDESQFLAQAMRYRMDPIPWRSVDGGSSGPLNTWILMWAPLFGRNAGYMTARITSLFCLWSMLAGLVFSLSELVNRRLALLFSLPAVTLVLACLNFDYVFFSSEQLPAALMAWSAYAIALQFKKATARTGYLIGLLTGALPFCKIQVGPSAVFLWIIGAMVTACLINESKKKVKIFTFQIAGGLTVPLIIMVPVIISGAWTDFFDLYIRAAVHYQNSASSPTMESFVQLLQGVSEFYTYLLTSAGILIVFLVSAIPGFPNSSKKHFLAGSSIVLFFLVVSYSIYRTGFSFPHYTQLLIVPAALLTAAPAVLVPAPSCSSSPHRLTSFGILGAIVALQLPQTFSNLRSHKQLLADWGSGVYPIGELLRKLAQPGETMFVWGYAPKYYVASGFAPASRFVQSMGLFGGGADYSQGPVGDCLRLMSDLEKYKLSLFVDAPDEFWIPDPAFPRGVLARHNNLKPLHDFVAEKYHFVQAINIGPHKVPVLIYQRNATQ